MGETIGLCGFLGLAALVFLRLLSVERETAILRAAIAAQEAAREERRLHLREARSQADHIRDVSDVELV